MSAPTTAPSSQLSAGQHLELRKERVWEAAKAPFKSLGMTVFMMFFAGSGLHLFTIMIVGMATMTPIKSMLDVNNVFSKLGGPGLEGEVARAKVVFVALNLLGLGVAMVKCYWMGLLPTAASDWVDGTPPTYREFTSGAVL
eukprot:RCo045020